LIIETSDPKRYFCDFFRLGEGSTVRITKDQRKFFGSICCEFWNRELFDYIFQGTEGPITLDNVINRLKFLASSHQTIEHEAEFCSLHLFEIELSHLCELPYEVFSEILSSKSLRLRDEDSLYELIKCQVCVDS
jgi:hypothetical protein